jgi:3-methyladenine DNA glycosylase AlkC
MNMTRKGATRIADIPEDILEKLNLGTLETATLAEALAINFVTLISHTVPLVTEEAAILIKSSDGITKRMAIAGKLLLDKLGVEGLPRIREHSSDTVRGWAAYMIAAIPNISLSDEPTLADRLNLIYPLADDNHFGVREWAWIALRPHIAMDIQESIKLLSPWSQDKSPNIRRFAIEITRPRGVWCCHIPALKNNPQIGLPLIEVVKSDESRYVQDSVANWLNDVSKSQPNWVEKICHQWQSESNNAHTIRICKRALRTIKKAKK